MVLDAIVSLVNTPGLLPGCIELGQDASVPKGRRVHGVSPRAGDNHAQGADVLDILAP